MGRAAAALCLLAACGSSGGSSDAAIDAPTGPWHQGPALPKPRLEPGVTALGQSLVVLGGFDTDVQAGLDITNQVDQFDLATMMWSQLPPAPVQWTHIQLAAIDGTLYLLGGLAGQQYIAHGEAYVLDTLGPSPAWQQVTSMPVGFERGSAAVVIAPPRIYLLGGAGTNAALATNIYYDIMSDAWGTDVPDLPAARSHPAGMRRTDGTLIVAGGLAGLDSTTEMPDVYSLTPLATSWDTEAPMPDPRGGCAYGVVQGALVCAGGEAGTSALSYNESYDPNTNMWMELPLMPLPRAGTQGAAIGQSLYVPGGAMRIQFEPTDTLFIYSPLDTAP